MHPTLRLPKGYSDFQKLRRAGLYYVDKTLLVDHVLNDAAEIILLSRPRRFGKTLNLSMLRYFFEKTMHERRSLFAGLKIEQSEEAWKHFQRYPTIFITFKDVKELSWQGAFHKITKLIAELYREHTPLLGVGRMSDFEKEEFQVLQQQTGSYSDIANSLRLLCKYLHDAYGEKVVLLIDEYDTPIHAAYEYGYYEDAIVFFRGLLSATLKDNVYVFRGVMTGIVRIAEESIFSGFNNFGVYSLTSTMYSDMFGFTENEVQELVHRMGQPELIDSLRKWYNGYSFGGRVSYNPWSVVSYLSAPADDFRVYWVNTLSNAMIRDYVLKSFNDLKPELERLLQGEGLHKPIYENISMSELHSNGDMVWSLLLFAGYLKPEALWPYERRIWAKLMIPNEEVYVCLADLVRSWFPESMGTTSSRVEQLLKALLQGDEDTLQELLHEMIKRSVSFHDSAEAFFHGFVVGLLVHLSEHYNVHSHRESGYRRYDVLITPKLPGKPGVVLEFKVVHKRKKETMKQAVTSAMKQLRDRDYASVLHERGASPIHQIAIAVEGKDVEVHVLSATMKNQAHISKKSASTTRRRAAQKKSR